MNYSQSLRYLNSFINFERVMLPEQNRMMNLDRMRVLLKVFGHPEKSFVPVLIAGTKGKGSTGYFLQSILEASGISSGFYSSPHLETPRERIRLRGRIISRQAWAEGLSRIRLKLKKNAVPARLGQVTYFEVLTLLALLTFQSAGVRTGVLEVGLGGRLDATNAVDSPIAVMTTLGMDHEAFLGPTLTHIVGEKAAIIRPGAWVVTAPQRPQAKRVLDQVIDEKGAHVFGPASVRGIRLGLEGTFQKINAGLAVRAAALLMQLCGGTLSKQAVERGLAGSDWAGRMERLERKGVRYLLDGAHNPDSTAALVCSLRQTDARRPRLLIFGASRDKRTDEMLRELAKFFSEVILTPIRSARSIETGILAAQAASFFKQIYLAANLTHSLALARRLASPGGLVTVTGSLYLVGEARQQLRRMHA